MTHRFASTLGLPRNTPNRISLAGKVYPNATYTLDPTGKLDSLLTDGGASYTKNIHVITNADERHPPKPIGVDAYWEALVPVSKDDFSLLPQATYRDGYVCQGSMETDGEGHFRAIGLLKKRDISIKSAPEVTATGEQSDSRTAVVYLETEQSNSHLAESAIVSDWFEIDRHACVVPIHESISQRFPTVVSGPPIETTVDVSDLFNNDDADSHVKVPGVSTDSNTDQRSGRHRRRLSDLFTGLKVGSSGRRRSSRRSKSSNEDDSK